MTTKTRTKATQAEQRKDSIASDATPKPKRDPSALQRAILTSMKDRPVVIRLLDGSELCGTLRAVDVYTVALQPEEAQYVDLYFKHAIAAVRLAREVTT